MTLIAGEAVARPRRCAAGAELASSRPLTMSALLVLSKPAGNGLVSVGGEEMHLADQMRP